MRGSRVPARGEGGRGGRLRARPGNRPGQAARAPAADPAGEALPPSPGTTGQLDRRSFLIAGTAAAALADGPSLKGLLGGSAPRRRPASADASVAGQWTAPFNLGLVSIHAVLLHTGQVLLFSWPTTKTVGSIAQLWNPVSGALTNISLAYQRDIFCSGTSVLSDGRVFIAGGHLYQGVFGNGVTNTTIFDPSSNSWTEGPVMSEARWYPTTMQLGDGTVVIFAGTSTPKVNATTIDHYNPATNTITTYPSTSDKSMATYPRMHLLTNGLLSWTNLATTYYFNPATGAWTKGPKLNSGGRGVNDTSILLPGLSDIMEIGGDTSAGPTATAEILNTAGTPPSWQYTSPMSFTRLWANTVILPDGTLLEVGGGSSGSYGDPVFTAELYNPATATWTEMAAQTAPRMYHSTALLLPDGRVLSAGESHGSYQNTGEIFSPPYLFAGARPTITSAPASLGYNQQFTISAPSAASIASVALVKAGAVTHSINFDQRYIGLTYQASGASQLTATSPPDSNHAPPGWYMLFIVNSPGVPSVASWVQVT
jgi:hypothetical protein